MDQPMASEPFFRLIRSRIKFRTYLLTRIPSAFFSGLRVPEADTNRCVVTIPCTWFTRNPFRSTYFACLSMAAEMSTGVLAMAHVYKSDPPISMLVVNLEANFIKKTTGLTRFVCSDGPLIAETIARAKATGEGQVVKAHSIGTNAGGDIVAEFFITWSFKVKSR